MPYVHLGDDLAKLIESYPDNPLITKNQREIWRARGRQRAVIRAMLGREHPHALKLLKDDGFDDQPVGSLSSRSAESFWNYGDNHVFPPTDDLIRFAIFMHLDLYRTLALVLKGQWEEFFAREICQWRANVGRNLSNILQAEDMMQEATSRFNPNTEDLFSRLLVHARIDPSAVETSLARGTSQGLRTLEALTEEMTDRIRGSGIRWLVEARYAPSSFDTLVQTMLLNKLHWVATDSRELEHFTKKAVEEVVICSHGTDDERHLYWQLTQARIQLLTTLDDMYLQIESVRLQNETIYYTYLSVFGEHEIALREARFRYYAREQKVLLKRENPELTWEGLDEQVQKKIEEMERTLKELRDQADYAALMVARQSMVDAAGELVGGGRPLTDDERSAYFVKCKKILRKIYMLVHPDRLRNDPVYQRLTPEQKEELGRILQEALRIRPDEPGLNSRYIESRYRSPDALQAVLDRVTFILENAGINVDPQLEIRGDTLPERLSWLEEDIGRLEGCLDEARVELQALMINEDVQLKRGILANDEKHDEIKKEMAEQTEEYRKQARELEAELEKLMGGAAA